MKFLAILRDSVRESLDAKTLYVLIGLSGLVILVAFSLSFRPEPAEKGVQAIVERFPGSSGGGGFRLGAPPLRYAVEDFKQLNEGRRPWEGEFRYELVVTESAPEGDAGDKGPDGGKDKGGKGKPQEKPGELFRALVFFTNLQTRDEDQLTEDERAARRRLLSAYQQAENVPPQEIRKFLADRLLAEVRRVGPAQMERFVKDQLVARGTLDVTEVRLEKDAGKEFRFAVVSRSRPETYRTWPTTLSLFFGALTIPTQMGAGPLVHSIEQNLVSGTGAGVAMLVAVVITAFFIPNMLRKGSVDLLLAKPVARWKLLVYKFVGGLVFMFIPTVVIVVGVWLALGVRSGLWPTGFLLTIFILTFQFAIFYAVSTLFGVLTRSPIVSILLACLLWAILFGVGTAYVFFDATREAKLFPNWAYVTVDTAHFVLPRYRDLDLLSSQLLARDLLGPDSPERKLLDRFTSSIHWGESLAVTSTFIALMLGLASWRFATRDY